MRTSRSTLAGLDCLISEPDTTDTTIATIVCLHGIGGDDQSFALQSEGLAGEFRVVVWNMPGYRESDRVAAMSFDVLADSLAQLVDVLDVGPVHLMGQSIGGMIAQEMFHRYPAKI